MLKINNLTAGKDDIEFITDVSFEIKPGERHVVVGNELSGKTALMRVLSRHPDIEILNGSVQFRQEDIHSFSADQLFSKGVFYGFQLSLTFSDMIIKDLFTEIFHDMDPKKLSDQLTHYSKLLGLDDYILRLPFSDTAINSNQAKLCDIMTMLIMKPSLIIVDEIEVGMYPESATLAFELIAEYLDNNPHASLLMLTSNVLPFNDLIKPTAVYSIREGVVKQVTE